MHYSHDNLIDLRRQLHAGAEPSNQEARTAETIRVFLSLHHPERLVSGVGGHGLFAVWGKPDQGGTVLVRAELDAVPIADSPELPWRSSTEGTAHKCGHDGHMAMVAGLAPLLDANPPVTGAVALLFQPAEETGEGAARMLADARMQALGPRYAVAIHNLPGFEAGAVVVKDGVFAAASTGVVISLAGSTSHAGEPDNGRNPASAMVELMQTLAALADEDADLADFARMTIVHARLGRPDAFGTTPGEAVVAATLRSFDAAAVDALLKRVESAACALAARHGLELDVRTTERFPALHNDEHVTAAFRAGARDAGLRVVELERPFRWSEDFAHIAAACPAALIGLGAGLAQPPLHDGRYDFPDALVHSGCRLLWSVTNRLLELAQVTS